MLFTFLAIIFNKNKLLIITKQKLRIYIYIGNNIFCWIERWIHLNLAWDVRYVLFCITAGSVVGCAFDLHIHSLLICIQLYISCTSLIFISWETPEHQNTPAFWTQTCKRCLTIFVMESTIHGEGIWSKYYTTSLACLFWTERSTIKSASIKIWTRISLIINHVHTSLVQWIQLRPFVVFTCSICFNLTG